MGMLRLECAMLALQAIDEAGGGLRCQGSDMLMCPVVKQVADP